MKKILILIFCLTGFNVLAQETITMPSSFDENQMVTKKMDANGNFVLVGQPMPNPVFRTENVPQPVMNSAGSGQSTSMVGAGNNVPDAIRHRQQEVQQIQQKAVSGNARGAFIPTVEQLKQAGVSKFQAGSIPSARGQYGNTPTGVSGVSSQQAERSVNTPEIVAAPLEKAPIVADGSAGLAYEAPAVPVQNQQVNVAQKEPQTRRLKAVMKNYGLPTSTFGQDTIQRVEKPTSSFSTNTMPQAVKSFRKEAIEYIECDEKDPACRMYDIDEFGQVIEK